MRTALRNAAFLGLAMLLLLGSACAARDARPAGAGSPGDTPTSVSMTIGSGAEVWGELVFEVDALRAPETAANFLRYVEDGYYDDTIIHRVLVAPGARIQIFQGGGYTALNAPSKPGQRAPIKLETQTGLTNARGTLAMARDSAPDTATSEWFFNVEANHRLDWQSPEKPGYAVFARLTSGWDVVERISRVPVRTNPDPELKGEQSQPIEAPRVIRARRTPAGSSGR